MTQRQQIFETMKTDLLKINISNGYSHDINKVFPVLRSIDDINELPSICLVHGEEIITPESEDRNVTLNTFRLVILTHIETNYDANSEGLFALEAEKWIEDYRNFISGDDVSVCTALKMLEGVQNVYISRIEPYADWRENKQTLEIVITVEYINSNY
jgi:hypothetical protein